VPCLGLTYPTFPSLTGFDGRAETGSETTRLDTPFRDSRDTRRKAVPI